jgi:hypothetical protein
MSSILSHGTRRTIQTKHIAPTNSRGARIKATFSHGSSVYLAYDYQLDVRENHDAAAVLLADMHFPTDPYGCETKLLRGDGIKTGWIYTAVPLGLTL